MLCGAAVLLAQSTVPQMKSVAPDTAKSGDELTVTGENLDQANVADVFLTDGTHDFKTTITSQEAGSLKVKVPAGAKAGRLALMVLTKGKDAKLIEQPVKVNIE
ncbi:MAG TPA: IPT/TIG domain-containing protein [Bryobacteraceae bacterium]